MLALFFPFFLHLLLASGMPVRSLAAITDFDSCRGVKLFLITWMGYFYFCLVKYLIFLSRDLQTTNTNTSI
jgi:hypothetical protein